MTADWRNPTEYPDPDTATPDTWAREFLRRNPSYRADWEHCVALRMKAGSGSPDDYAQSVYLSVVETPMEEDETLAKYYTVRAEEGRISKWEIATAEKYGINRMADPGRDDEWRSLMWETDKITTYGQSLIEWDGQGNGIVIQPFCGNAIVTEGRYDLSVSAEEVYVRFKLAWPAGPQLERAKRVLGNLQADFKRQHPERAISKRKRESHYRTYLQLLDADEAGASEDEMAALLPEDLKMKGSDLGNAVKYSLAAARQLRDGDYLFLLL